MSEPAWAWWGPPYPEFPLRHAGPVLQAAGAIEQLIARGGQGGQPLDRALHGHQRARKAMGRTDRLLLGTASYAFARNRLAVLEASAGWEWGRGDLLHLALLDACGGRAEQARGLRGGIARWESALERLSALRQSRAEVLERHSDRLLAGAPAGVREALAVLCSVPEWWLDLGPWETVGEALQELAALRRPQRLCLRVQTHRADRDKVLNELREAGVPSAPTERSPWGIVVEGRHNVLALDVFRRGEIEVQDEGSQLVAALCDPKPGERILDLCAGGGGKSLALASLLGGRGAVVAHDASTVRLADTRTRARKAELGNIRVVESADALPGLGPFGLVLVDAPCSSSGTLRRNPDVAWRWSRAAVARLEDAQRQVLDQAASLVAPGGTLVYATCSLLRVENDAQCETFLERHPEFVPHPPGDRRAHGALADIGGGERGWFRLPANLPRYAGDAFFAARFRRRP